MPIKEIRCTTQMHDAIGNLKHADKSLMLKNKIPTNINPNRLLKLCSKTLLGVGIILAIAFVVFSILFGFGEDRDVLQRILGASSLVGFLIFLIGGVFVWAKATDFCTDEKISSIIHNPLNHSAREIEHLVDTFNIMAKGWNSIESHPELHADVPDYFERMVELRNKIEQAKALWQHDFHGQELAELGHEQSIEGCMDEAVAIRDDLLETRQFCGRSPLGQRDELLEAARAETTTLQQVGAARARVGT